MAVADADAALCRAVLERDGAIRYAAIGRAQAVVSESREELDGASAASSDFFEELLVNPALLLLARQRGELDCGGLRYVVVAYGNFNQLVIPLGPGAHLSVALELSVDAQRLASELTAVITGAGR